MSRVAEILKVAQRRGREIGLPYEGALLPAEAFEVLSQTSSALLVDVRTQAEWDWVGFVPGSVHVEWQHYPTGGLRDDFLENLQTHVPEDALVLFMCRSGARSHAAAEAATRVGWNSCYNVLHGFEGDRDPQGHRGRLNGWRAAGLPWKQN
ncbi:MAG: rhodanese-like domain-containing protein [Ferrovum sp.]|nr:rhodanese-like domain-containing protein [Ferrovum sp.]NDU87411.1 rhodanese-like domain-containing protein [Ferrovum sp.]